MTPKMSEKPEATRNNMEPNDTPLSAVNTNVFQLILIGLTGFYEDGAVPLCRSLARSPASKQLESPEFSRISSRQLVAV